HSVHVLDLSSFSRAAPSLTGSAAHFSFFFFFNDPAPTEIYTLSLHDALPICRRERRQRAGAGAGLRGDAARRRPRAARGRRRARSEEHTSELQSLTNLVCRLLLEKKKKNQTPKQLRSRAATCETEIQ